jgi:hypothetical protein
VQCRRIFHAICGLLLASNAPMAIFSVAFGSACRAKACQFWSRGKFRTKYLYRPGFVATFILLDVRPPSKAGPAKSFAFCYSFSFWS